MSLNLEIFKDPNRCLFLDEHSSFLEFRPDAHRGHGFSLSQLFHYTLEANFATKDSPPQRLTLGFSTADVVVTGWRLDTLAEELRGHKGGIIKTLPVPERYRNLEPHSCAVAEITVKPIGK